MGDVRASKISFLGLATNGPSLGTARSSTAMGRPKMCRSTSPIGRPAGGPTATRSSPRPRAQQLGGRRRHHHAHIFATVPPTLDTTKLVEDVILPENVTSGIQHIFAVAHDSLTIPTASIDADHGHRG